MPRPELTIVIPFKDEAKRLPKSLAKVIAFTDRYLPPTEIILVDDGSRDGSQHALRKYLNHPRVSLLTHTKNKGKGAAVRTGVLKAKGKYILFSDADLSTPIKEVKKLLATVAKNNCAIAIGSRALPESIIRTAQSPLRIMIGKSGNLLIRLVTGLPYRDTQCGFKLFKAQVAKELFKVQHFPKWSFDIEILYQAKLKNYAVCEVPVEWSDAAGSKVQSFSDPLQVLRDVFRIKQTYKP